MLNPSPRREEGGGGGTVLARDEPGELQVARTEGSFVFDEKGRRYIDFMMGWCVGNFGWGNAVLVEEARTFRGADYVYPGYSYAPWAELAKLLVSIAPPGLTKAFRATGGSEAVDLALQAAMIHTGRRGFISLEESYHGNSLGGLSVGDSENRERIRNLLPHCSKIKPPLNEQALDKIESAIQWRKVSLSFIMSRSASISACSFPSSVSCKACNASAGRTAPC